MSHFPFAHDTMIMRIISWVNFCAIKSILLLFELMLDLKVNFNKSLLVSINVSKFLLVKAVDQLHCKIEHTHFKYLCVPIRDNLRRLSF